MQFLVQIFDLLACVVDDTVRLIHPQDQGILQV